MHFPSNIPVHTDHSAALQLKKMFENSAVGCLSQLLGMYWIMTDVNSKLEKNCRVFFKMIYLDTVSCGQVQWWNDHKKIFLRHFLYNDYIFNYKMLILFEDILFVIQLSVLDFFFNK